jgi:alkylhydroperoxidase family enzyme
LHPKAFRSRSAPITLPGKAHWGEADCYSAPQRAVLGYAEHLGAGAPRDDAALDACFSPAEQTELTVTGATYIALARMLRALDVRIDEGLSG